MPKNKRKSDSENAVGEQNGRSKSKRGKGLKTGFATLTICAAAFGAYYSPHFRAASSDWLERGRALVAKFWSNGALSQDETATEDEKMREMLAQAPSFRDFLTEEYGEDEARELLGIDTTSPITTSGDAVGSAISWENAEAREVAMEGETAFPTARPTASFADYVAAETAEDVKSQEFGTNVDAALNSPLPESGPSFADYVAAETSETQEFTNVGAPTPELEGNSSFASDADIESETLTLNDEKTRLAATAETLDGEDETALAARLQDEMKERGVGNPRIERWGERFWRASGFATTAEGVATFCEAVDVDPAAAQRAALAKFEAASF
jgi:hypothetical protein